MKDNYSHLNNYSDSYRTNLESIKKTFNSFQNKNEDIANNLINKTQNLLNHSLNLIKNHGKNMTERYKEYSTNAISENLNNKSTDLYSTGNHDLSKNYNSYELNNNNYNVTKSISNKTSKANVVNYLKQLEYELFDRNKMFRNKKITELIDGIYHEISDLVIKKDRLKIKLIDANNFIAALKSELERKNFEKKETCLCDLKNYEILSLKKIIDELTENYSKKCAEIEEFNKKSNENQQQNINENYEEKLKSMQTSIDEKEEIIDSLKSTIVELKGNLDKTNNNKNDNEYNDFKKILKNKEDMIDKLSTKIVKLNKIVSSFKEFEKFKSSDPQNLIYQFNRLKHLQENNATLISNNENLKKQIEDHKNTINELSMENRNLASEINLKSHENNHECNVNNSFAEKNNNDSEINNNHMQINTLSNQNNEQNEEGINLKEKLQELETKYNELLKDFDIIKSQNDSLKNEFLAKNNLIIEESIQISIIAEDNYKITNGTPQFKGISSPNLYLENENLKSKLNKLIIIEQNYELVKNDFNLLMRDYNDLKDNVKDTNSTDIKLKLIDKDREIRELNNTVIELVKQIDDLKKDMVDIKAKNIFYLEENQKLIKMISENQLNKNNEIKRSIVLKDKKSNSSNCSIDFSNLDYSSNKISLRQTPELIDTNKGKMMFTFLDNRRIIQFNSNTNSFRINYFQDLGNFEQNFNNYGSLQLNIFDGLLVLTGENHDTLFFYNSIKNTVSKISKLKENHSYGGLFYYDKESSLFALSGYFNKIVEKCYNFNSNIGNHKVFNWIQLNEMKIERAECPYVILNEMYLYSFFGYNHKTNRFLNTIERLNLRKQTQWEIINFYNYNLLSTARKSFASIKLNEEEVLFIGGYDGEKDRSIELFSIFNIKNNQFNLIEREVSEIDNNHSYFFQKNTNFNHLNDNFDNIFFNFDTNNNLHIVDVNNLKHDVFKCD